MMMTDMTDIPKGTVLLVDDDSFLADMYTAHLTQQGFSVHESLGAAAGLEALRGGFVPDVIVFDIMMPDMDGFAFIDTVKQEGLAPQARLIALTNDPLDGKKERLEALGALHLVKATTEPSDLVAAIVGGISGGDKGTAGVVDTV
ncbi:response regulator [Candidatus Kaiserbacteria bacterium]|nr:response regulator [Candidatus Kaiserbacteria bacterium]